MTEKFQLILNMTEEELRQATIAYRLKVLIKRAGEQGITQASAFNKLGLGMTAEQFNKLVDGLVASYWCNRKPTPDSRKKDSMLLTINPEFKDINLPDAPEKF
jgi:hypothetical protein